MYDAKAEFGSKEAGSLGGEARAKALTKPERSLIAREAAEARWAKKGKKVNGTPRALAEAPLVICHVEFECAVLDDEKNTRVLSERAFARAIGAKRGGSHWQRQKQNPGGAKLPVFLSANNLEPFISSDLRAALSEPMLYIPAQHGSNAFGIRAELVPQILDVWLKARDAGKLRGRQKDFAILADTLVRGLATTGIVALIDEATGFERVRPPNALSKLIEAFIEDDFRKYVSRFPLSFFRELCRLKGVPFREDMRLPRYFGHHVNDLVWDRLAPGILEELKRKNPTDPATGRRKRRHIQWLTADVGDPRLLHHLGMLEGMARGFKDGEYDKFVARLDMVIPRWSDRVGSLFADVADHDRPPVALLPQ